MPIRLLTLGGLSSAVNGAELDWLGSQWLRAAVLVYLTLERSATRDALQAVFWPDSDADSAGHRLSQAVYALRRALGDDAIETRGRELRAGPHLEADALDFEKAIESNRYENAITLYDGPFLDGVHLAPTNAFQTWVDARRAKYARDFRKACRAVVDARAASGDLQGAIAIAQKWGAPDPLDDEAQHRLIELLALAGARNDALKQYENYTRLLEAEGLEPLDQTRELASAIERQTNGSAFPARESVRPPERPSLQHVQPQPTPPPAPERASGRLLVRFGAMGIAVLALLWVIALFAPEEPSPEAALAPPEPIAVLVFQDETGGQLTWLANGLTRSLVDAFHNVSALRVRSMHAVWPYRNGLTPHAEIARILGVKWLIVGSVRQTGDRVFARAELVDGSTSDLIEPSEVDYPPGEEIPLIEDVVAAVSTKLEASLRLTLGREVRFQRWHAETRSETAFQLVQRAADLILARHDVAASGDWNRSLETLRSADSTLAVAATEDPEWPEPWIQRAWVDRHIAFLTFGMGVNRDVVNEALRSGIQHANRALTQEPRSAHALEVRGILRHASARIANLDSVQSSRLVQEAQTDLDSATALDPNLARALSNLSSIHYVRADLTQAALLAEQAYAADAYLEDAQEILNRLFTIRFETAEDREAQKWCTLIGQRFPNSWDHARCELLLMAWDRTKSPDLQRAWLLADSAILHTPERFRASVAAQLHFLVAGVIARSGPPDSAAQVLTRTRARATSAGLYLVSPGNAVLLYNEIGARVILNDTSTARKLLNDYLRHPLANRAHVERSRQFRALLR